MTEPSVTNAADGPRKAYEIHLDGARAGLTAYVDAGAQRIFFHTEIGEEYGGRGLAGTLIAAALAETRAAGKRIVAICPFVAAYVEKHHDFDDILDPVTPEAKAAVRAALA
ncbi:GNAT family N-acetyltransferase [[Mycobacterium] vasticus]|uniref:GNAT family N-acetyltransferase n=1 Tax=[Mycobacterium] vasticus TaxID=2875777 RepID=A0ABU5YXS2_9MYCO|nr:GNAT family N-acetyltransferase [Mycolicibacter sp. MYC017]MEB3069924.1 GNAT family N-acetyltransferase [Mycolicibacter sp. MYC017]